MSRKGRLKTGVLYKELNGGQDPAIFKDDDYRVYIYWGSGGTCFAAELNSDLMSIKPDTKVELTRQLTNVFEGPWVHKYQGKYYLSYPGLTNGQWPEEMYYAISEKPLGPYTFKGKYIPEFKGQAGTNHGSIVKFKGKWIALHHSAMVSGGKSEVRSLMGDYLYYNPDGTIQPIVPNPAGLSEGKPFSCIIFLEAENAPMAGGKLMETKIANEFQGFSGKGYVTNFLHHYNYLQVLVQVAKDTKAKMIVRLSSDADFSADILVGNLMRDGWNGTPLKKTNGWEEIDLGEVSLKEGDNLIRINSHQEVNLKVDYVKLIMP